MVAATLQSTLKPTQVNNVHDDNGEDDRENVHVVRRVAGVCPIADRRIAIAARGGEAVENVARAYPQCLWKVRLEHSRVAPTCVVGGVIGGARVSDRMLAIQCVSWSTTARELHSHQNNSMEGSTEEKGGEDSLADGAESCLTASVPEKRLAVLVLRALPAAGDPGPVSRLARRVGGERQRVHGGEVGVVHGRAAVETLHRVSYLQ